MITGKGTALSALTGGGLRNHHFRLSLVPWCAFPVSEARASARSWLPLCQHWAHAVPVPLALVPGAAGLGHLLTSPNQLTRCLHKL